LKGSGVLSEGFVARIALSFLVSVFAYFVTPYLLSEISFLDGLLLLFLYPTFLLSLIFDAPVYVYFIAFAVFVLAFWLLGYYFE